MKTFAMLTHDQRGELIIRLLQKLALIDQIDPCRVQNMALRATREMVQRKFREEDTTRTA